MDVIDSNDFDYAPLLALEPAYLFSMRQSHANEADILDLVPEEIPETPLHEYYLPEPCHDSSRVSAMPTNRAYGTCYAMHTNMPTHGLHGLHAVIIMDLDVHGHALYKYRHACPTTTNGCLG